MQLANKKYIDNSQQSGRLPTRAAIFFNLMNQFNRVSREEFKNVIATSFPELLPLATLFYDQPNTFHYKWNDGSWRCLLMEEGTSQGCPLSPLFALFVVAQLLEPIDGLLRECAAARLTTGDTGNDDQGRVSHLLSLLMISHPSSTFPISSFSVNRSAPMAPPLDALSTHTKPEY